MRILLMTGLICFGLIGSAAADQRPSVSAGGAAGGVATAESQGVRSAVGPGFTVITGTTGATMWLGTVLGNEQLTMNWQTTPVNANVVVKVRCESKDGTKMRRVSGTTRTLKITPVAAHSECVCFAWMQSVNATDFIRAGGTVGPAN